MNITNIGKPVVLEEIQAVDVSAFSRLIIKSSSFNSKVKVRNYLEGKETLLKLSKLGC